MTNAAKHQPAIPVPEGAKLWRVGWFIEAADGEGMPITAPDDLRWAQCMTTAGGTSAMQQAAQQIGLSLSRHVEALSEQGSLQELEV